MIACKIGNVNINRINKIIGITLVIMGLGFVGNVLKSWVYIPVIAYSAVALGLTLTMVFLGYPAKRPNNIKDRKNRDQVPWYDLIFIVTSMISTGYIAFFGDIWRESVLTGFATSIETVLCFSLALLIVEATRRTIGWVLSLTILGFLIYVPFSVDFSFTRATTLMYFLPSGIVGNLVNLAFTIILMILLFGAFMQKTKAGIFLVNTLTSLTGRWTGGTAKAAVLSSCVVGALTGVGPATTAVSGSISIPLMKKSGYKSHFAAAVEGVAANGSSLMPPVMGIAAFIMADFLNMQYWSLCLVAFIPAFLYYWGLLVQVHLESKKLGLTGIAKDDLPKFWPVFKDGWFYLLPLVLFIYLLAIAKLPVEHCGMYAAFAMLVIAIIDWQKSKQSRKNIQEIIRLVFDAIGDAGKMMIIPGVACAGAGIIIATVSASGISFKIGMMLLNVAGNNLFFLLAITAIVSFVLGMGLPPLPCYLIMATLIAPALIEFGLPDIVAHLFVYYWGLTAMITPPVAVVIYISSGIANADPIKSGILACRLGFLSFVLPFIFAYKNELLLIGDGWSIVQCVAMVFLAILVIGAAFEGFFIKSMGWVERVAFVVGGALILWPDWRAALAGIIVIGFTIIWQFSFRKKGGIHVAS